MSEKTNTPSMSLGTSFSATPPLAAKPSRSRLSDSCISDTTSPMSAVGASSRQLRRRKATHGSTSQPKSALTRAAPSSGSAPGSAAAIHDACSGRQPIWLGSTYTMPQRDTVAGDATARSSTSNIIVICSLSCMISPETRHSFLLSSSTVFMFSIQIASTGPSNMTHLRSGLVSRAALRKSTGSTPSVHSLDTASSQPYSWPMDTDLGLSV
mmetsp:Transcript_31112/g.92663  ORF Transcript_31112/g.92663 Transcript_31112/m.92663 type:complete len:211 (+) Transcript_31112:583-1215(+)